MKLLLWASLIVAMAAAVLLLSGPKWIAVIPPFSFLAMFVCLTLVVLSNRAAND